MTSWIKAPHFVQLFYRSQRIILEGVPGLGDLCQDQAEVNLHVVILPIKFLPLEGRFRISLTLITSDHAASISDTQAELCGKS